MSSNHRHGAILASGRNIHPYRTEKEIEVQWLGIGVASFRRQAVEEEPFDENFDLGEDVEFSYRVGRKWRLIVTPEARLEHHKSAISRVPKNESIAREIEFRHNWIKTKPGKNVNLAAFWISVIGEMTIAFVAGALRRDPDGYMRARAIARGGWSCLRGRATQT